MRERRRIAVISTGRQDLGILRSTLKGMLASDKIETLVWAGGMHLQPRFGERLSGFEEAGLPVHRTIEFLAEPPEPIADTARAVSAVGAALEEDRPDAFFLVGDRSETLAAGLAATMARIPIAHLHGGEETEGATDNAFRHALTKMSHLHLVAHSEAAERVLQMGEEPSSVHVVGPPGVDHLYREDLPSRGSIAEELGHRLSDPLVLVTVHPATLGGDAGSEVAAVAEAMSRVPATYVVSRPNADEGGSVINDFWTQWAAGRNNVIVVEALGANRYWALLREASAMLGNSSSGILEAPWAGVPVVNVGDRQGGRLRLGRIADVPADAGAIGRALKGAVSVGRRPLSEDPRFPRGPAGPRIVKLLEEWKIPNPPVKIFVTRNAGAR
ncbi:MAG: UDP-N-acetylglucosamine 2-epimerase [Gemmatimonadota bacterium]|nr:UDP-N-acetylglucosamine 2-epimerase [Gemmatimonadota bacterium]